MMKQMKSFLGYATTRLRREKAEHRFFLFSRTSERIFVGILDLVLLGILLYFAISSEPLFSPAVLVFGGLLFINAVMQFLSTVVVPAESEISLFQRIREGLTDVFSSRISSPYDWTGITTPSLFVYFYYFFAFLYFLLFIFQDCRQMFFFSGTTSGLSGWLVIGLIILGVILLPYLICAVVLFFLVFFHTFLFYPPYVFYLFRERSLLVRVWQKISDTLHQISGSFEESQSVKRLEENLWTFAQQKRWQEFLSTLDLYTLLTSGKEVKDFSFPWLVEDVLRIDCKRRKEKVEELLNSEQGYTKRMGIILGLWYSTHPEILPDEEEKDALMATIIPHLREAPVHAVELALCRELAQRWRAKEFWEGVKEQFLRQGEILKTSQEFSNFVWEGLSSGSFHSLLVFLRGPAETLVDFPPREEVLTNIRRFPRGFPASMSTIARHLEEQDFVLDSFTLQLYAQTLEETLLPPHVKLLASMLFYSELMVSLQEFLLHAILWRVMSLDKAYDYGPLGYAVSEKLKERLLEEKGILVKKWKEQLQDKMKDLLRQPIVLPA